MINKNDFFADVADQLNFWIDSSLSSITKDNEDLTWTDNQDAFEQIRRIFSENKLDGSQADLRQVLSECLRGYTNSLLSVLDGTSQLSNKGRVYLVDESGARLGEGLHDEFFSYLLDNGQLD
jgi:hypothetical protein